jgi:uncharacterized protein (TIGR02757 family)
VDSLRPHHLKHFLDLLLTSQDAYQRRLHDPVSFVWDYAAPADQEVVALIASCLAYGRVDLLRKAIAEVLAPLGSEPSMYLRHCRSRDLDVLYRGFTYRMTRGADIVDLLTSISQVLLEEGSLQQAYEFLYRGDHLETASQFVRLLRARRRREELVRGFAYLLPDPATGSASKRLHLFFRWVARGPDAVDLGIWRQPGADQLRMPLDTHTARLCRYLGLTTRSTADGKAVEEVTAALRRLCPEDPMRYDFALCHLGISGRCIHRRSAEHCPGCPIEPVCKL